MQKSLNSAKSLHDDKGTIPLESRSVCPSARDLSHISSMPVSSSLQIQ